MKRIFVSLSFMLAIGLATAFAGNKTDVNNKIKESFKKEFTEAELVTWDKIDGYQIARFVFHRHAAIAYFNEEGELLGAARTIFFDELPIAVTKSFEKNYAAAYFIEVAEISNNEGTSYTATLTTKGKDYHIKIDSDGHIMHSSRIK